LATHTRLPGHTPLTSEAPAFCARVDDRTTARAGRKAPLSVDPTGFHFFDPNSGKRIAAKPPHWRHVIR
jgi:hypothetical protein